MAVVYGDDYDSGYSDFEPRRLQMMEDEKRGGREMEGGRERGREGERREAGRGRGRDEGRRTRERERGKMEDAKGGRSEIGGREEQGRTMMFFLKRRTCRCCG